MAKIDVVKEEIAYLKLWLGIAVVTDVSLFSWLVTSVGHAGIFLAVVAFIAVAVITTVVASLHIRIAKLIKELEKQ